MLFRDHTWYLSYENGCMATDHWWWKEGVRLHWMHWHKTRQMCWLAKLFNCIHVNNRFLSCSLMWQQLQVKNFYLCRRAFNMKYKDTRAHICWNFFSNSQIICNQYFFNKVNWSYRRLVKYCDTCAKDFAARIPRDHISPHQSRTLLIWRHSMAAQMHNFLINK